MTDDNTGLLLAALFLLLFLAVLCGLPSYVWIWTVDRLAHDCPPAEQVDPTIAERAYLLTDTGE